jgi:UDP-N-acetylglucosamine 2-epimerase (non-hydrolysing)
MKPSVVHLIAAARPNFMKIAPLWHALTREKWARPVLVHTGQHYDPTMSDAFFRDLELPPAQFHLGVGSGSHAEQVANVMLAYERACRDVPPDWIVVVGDVNSTLACALVGVKMGHRVAHLESGLRSRDRRMPEEINRLAVDAICDVLWTPSADADANLLAEGADPGRIECVGNIMIDSYELQRARIEATNTPERLGLAPKGYGVLTLHRPSNVDDRATLTLLALELARAAEQLPLVFPVHPRTRQRLQSFGLWDQLGAGGRVRLIEPLGYLAFMSLVSNARAVITDSGGVQEETTYLDIPCLTLRENTERPITITEGTNRLVKPGDVVHSLVRALAGDWPHGKRPNLWDGRAAERICASLKRRSATFATPAAASVAGQLVTS